MAVVSQSLSDGNLTFTLCPSDTQVCYNLPQMLPPDVCYITPDVGDITPDVGDIAPDVGDITPDVGDITPDVGDITPDVVDIILFSPGLAQHQTNIGSMSCVCLRYKIKRQ